MRKMARKAKKKPKSKLQKAKERPGSLYWRTKADKVWSKLILRKNRGKCLFCGEPAVDPHHLIPRGLAATRHDLDNGIPLCREHHKFNPRISAHGGPLGFACWLEQAHRHLYKWVNEHKYDLCPRPDYRANYYQLKAMLEGRQIEP